MSDLQQLMENIKGQGKPPVHFWKPEICGDIDIQIDAQGCWFHEGAAITRDRLVTLFASVLWFEEGQYYLVTPVEKMRITVEDVPFIVIDADYSNQQWVATTNLGDWVVIGKDNEVELRLYRGQWVPYVRIRYDLWARLSRNVYHQWINQALEKGDKELSLNSGDYPFLVAKE